MNETTKKLLKRTKSFTLCLAIIYTVMSVFSAIGSISMVMMQSIDVSTLGLSEAEAELFNSALDPAVVYPVYVLTIAYIVLTVFLYIFNAKLKKGKIVPKIPYFLILAIEAYNIVSALIGFQIWALINLAIHGVIAVLALLVIVNLFKLEPEDNLAQQ